MKSTNKAARLPADLQTAVDTQFQRFDNKARRPYERDHAAWCCRKCAKYGSDCHTCCKFGIFEPYLLQVWWIVPNLLQVWQRYYDNPTWRYSSSTSLAALFQQRQLGSTKAIKEFQVSRLKIKTICITGGFGAHAISLRLRVALMYIDCFATHLQNLYIIQTQF